MDLHNIREDYSKRELSESECRADPIVQFEQWLNEAIHSQVNEPTAVNVASVGEDGIRGDTMTGVQTCDLRSATLTAVGSLTCE